MTNLNASTVVSISLTFRWTQTLLPVVWGFYQFPELYAQFNLFDTWIDWLFNFLTFKLSPVFWPRDYCLEVWSIFTSHWQGIAKSMYWTNQVTEIVFFLTFQWVQVLVKMCMEFPSPSRITCRSIQTSNFFKLTHASTERRVFWLLEMYSGRIFLWAVFGISINSEIVANVITCLRTRSAAVRHWRDLSLSAYERDLVTNEKI